MKGPFLELVPWTASIFPLQRQLLAAAEEDGATLCCTLQSELSPSELWHDTSVTSMLLQRTRLALLHLQMGGSKNRQPELLLSPVNWIELNDQRKKCGPWLLCTPQKWAKHQTLEQEEGASTAACRRKNDGEKDDRSARKPFWGGYPLLVSYFAPVWQKPWKANAEWHTSNSIVPFNILMHVIEDLPFMTFARSTGSPPDR